MARPAGSASRAQNVKLTSFTRRNRKRKVNQNVSKSAIRRLARRGGVKRISALMYDETRAILKLYLTSLVKDSIIYCDYAKRSTVMAEDVVRSIKNRGQRLYGFDERPFRSSRRSPARLMDRPSPPTLRSTNHSEIPTRSFPRRPESMSSTANVTSVSLSETKRRKRNVEKAESSNSTVENLPIFRRRSSITGSRGNFLGANDSEVILSSEDECVQSTARK